MIVQNLLTISDEEFLSRLIRCWQEAYEKWLLSPPPRYSTKFRMFLPTSEELAFRHWAVATFCFARGNEQ